MRLRLALAVYVAASLWVAPSAFAADPIMRLAEVRSGMKCEGRSVIRGTAIARFDVEILDVIQGDPSAAGARILIRVSGPAVADTGVGPGFSGSPIYCRGSDGVPRNAGAISESVGEYGNEVALATPIEEVIGQPPEAPAGARSAPALRRSARRIAAPLTVSGLSAPLRRSLSRAAKRARQIVFPVPPGPLGGFPVQDLQPGSAVAAGLASGDIATGKIGTVAYRDRSAIWIFGHQLDAAGRRALLLQDAYVFTVISNPLGTDEGMTAKLALPGHTLGVLSNDGLNQVVGRIGPPPRTIPLRVHVRDGDAGRTAALSAQVSDERHLELGSSLKLIGALAVTQATGQLLGSAPTRFRTEMCVRIKLRERVRRLAFCDDYHEAVGPLDDLTRALGRIDQFKFGRITPTDVSVRMRIGRRVSEAFLLGARAPRRVRPGQRIRVRLLLQRRRGGRFRLSVPVRVPRTLPPGRRSLTLRGVVPTSLEEAFEDGIEQLLEDLADGVGSSDNAPGPRSVDALAESIRALGAPQGLRASFVSGERGPVVLRRDGLLLRGKVRLPVRVVAKRRR